MKIPQRYNFGNIHLIKDLAFCSGSILKTLGAIIAEKNIKLPNKKEDKKVETWFELSK